MSRQTSLGCPSHGADHLWDGGDPTALQERVWGVLEDAEAPESLCRLVDKLVGDWESAREHGDCTEVSFEDPYAQSGGSPPGGQIR